MRSKIILCLVSITFITLSSCIFDLFDENRIVRIDDAYFCKDSLRPETFLKVDTNAVYTYYEKYPYNKSYPGPPFCIYKSYKFNEDGTYAYTYSQDSIDFDNGFRDINGNTGSKYDDRFFISNNALYIRLFYWRPNLIIFGFSTSSNPYEKKYKGLIKNDTITIWDEHGKAEDYIKSKEWYFENGELKRY